MSVRDDQLIFGYLSQVADAAHGRLPSLARQDLVEKVRHEIDERRRRAGNADITRVLQSMGDPRAVVDRAVQLGGGEYAGYRDQLALTRLDPRRAWYAAAYDGGSRRFAGRAWSFLDGEFAGIFDMAVWEPFRRRGLGSGLLAAVCAAARDAGARHAVLNATPEGKQLYSSCGFTQIGEGITWWLHLKPGNG